MGEWQPINTAPRDGTRVILAYPNGSVEFSYFIKIHETRNGVVTTDIQHWSRENWTDSFSKEKPTHWMPTPESPHA